MNDDRLNWFHGNVTRDEAETLIQDAGLNGIFLVRQCTTAAGDYVLTLMHNDQVLHYQIRNYGKDAFYSIDDGPIIHGLEKLIEYYCDGGEGLATSLTSWVPGKTPPPETRQHGRSNLLHKATAQGHLEIVKHLIKQGTHNLDAKDSEGKTALHLSCILGKTEMMELLLEAGVNVNVVDSLGLAPLHYACQNNKPHCVRILMNVGSANPQTRAASTGWVALHDAASRGFLDCVRNLLVFGAPCRPQTSLGETPEDLAMRNGHFTTAKLLEMHQPSPAHTKREEWCHEEISRTEAVHLLESHGNKNGTFFIRRSVRQHGKYVLTMSYSSHNFNFEISEKRDFFCINAGPLFDSLEHLVGYYMNYSDGLPHLLVTPISPQESLNNAVTCQTFRTTENQVLPELPSPRRNRHKSIPDVFHGADIRFGEVLGEGEFGSVYKGTVVMANGNKVHVAIKTLRDEQVAAGREEFARETEVMLNLNHPCIVKLYAVRFDPRLMMIQELVEMGSLLDYLVQFPQEVNPSTDLRLWAAQIAYGMVYLKEKRFVHRDLAARNILLKSRSQVKISDFGLSRAIGCSSEYYKASQGGRWPVKWYAPESVYYGNFSHASDVWSFGITLWEMYTYGEHPYGESTGVEVIEKIGAGYRLPRPPRSSIQIYTLMKRCWEYESADRITFEDLHTILSSDPVYVNYGLVEEP